MLSRLRSLPETAKADLLIAVTVFVLLSVGTFLVGFPAWAALGFAALAGPGAAHILRSARISHEREYGPLPPRSVADTVRLLGVGLVLSALAAGVVYWWLSR